MNTSLKPKISKIESGLAQLKKRHSNWNPVDNRTIENWIKNVNELKKRVEYGNQPIVRDIMKYLLKSIKEINQLLLEDKKLSAEERRVIMEKREMYQGMANIFTPGEEVVAGWEREIEYQLSNPHDAIASHYQN